MANTHTLSATFAIDTFTITPSVDGGAAGHGTISPATPQAVDWHSTPDVHVRARRRLRGGRGAVDGTPVTTGGDEYTFPAVTEGHTISVSFRQLTLSISVSAGEHGSVTPGTGSVAWGSTPEYAITPDEGYRVADVLVDGSSVGSGRELPVRRGDGRAQPRGDFVAEGMPWARRAAPTAAGASGRSH